MPKSSTSLYCYKTCRCRPCCKCDRKNYGQKEQRVEFDYSRIDTSKTFFTPSNVNVIWLSRCSLNRYCVFFKNSRKFALKALKVTYSDVGEGGISVNCKKNTIFPEHPRVFIKYCVFP